jgi:hypothetical protein
MPNRNRLTNMLLALVAGLLILNLVIGRSQISRAATPTEYKQLLVSESDVEKTLNASAKEGWELAQIYRTPNMGSIQVYLVLKK